MRPGSVFRRSPSVRFRYLMKKLMVGAAEDSCSLVRLPGQVQLWFHDMLQGHLSEPFFPGHQLEVDARCCQVGGALKTH